MVFSSLLFLFFFLPLTLALYFCSPRKMRNFVLLVASLVFYAWGEVRHVPLMLFCIASSYAGGNVIARFLERGKKRAAKVALAIFCVAVLVPLVFFKYTVFMLESLGAVLGIHLPLPDIALPIGISFYTFQAISYLADMYRGMAASQKNAIDFGTYIALFPQLVAGPIVRYSDISVQLKDRTERISDAAKGIRRFVVGLGKKALLANTVGALWNEIQFRPEIAAATAWIGLAAFTFQIYFDFSAYSDMAIGLGKIFGFTFPENFDHPYLSKSVTEFWRRWHISLGTWFREYVYIPLGGNRAGTIRHVRNILVVWLLTGIWHGASWNFVLWGVYYGALLLLEKFVLGSALEKIPRFLRHLYCLFCVAIGWALFAFDSVPQGVLFVGTLFGARGRELLDGQSAFLLRNNAVLLALCAVGSTAIPHRIAERIFSDTKSSSAIRFVVAGMVEIILLTAVFALSVACIVDATFNPFLYFRF